jgi:hypothetical protein
MLNFLITLNHSSDNFFCTKICEYKINVVSLQTLILINNKILVKICLKIILKAYMP